MCQAYADVHCGRYKTDTIVFILNFYVSLYNNMCTYNTRSSHTDHLKSKKRDSEESLLTFVNLFFRVKALRVLMGTAAFKRVSLQIGRLSLR